MNESAVREPESPSIKAFADDHSSSVGRAYNTADIALPVAQRLGSLTTESLASNHWWLTIRLLFKPLSRYRLRLADNVGLFCSPNGEVESWISSVVGGGLYEQQADSGKAATRSYYWLIQTRSNSYTATPLSHREYHFFARLLSDTSFAQIEADFGFEILEQWLPRMLCSGVCEVR